MRPAGTAPRPPASPGPEAGAPEPSGELAATSAPAPEATGASALEVSNAVPRPAVQDRLHQTVSVALAPLAGLTSNPRLSRGLVRTAACVVLGGVLLFLVNWLACLLGVAVVIVIDTLYQSRTSAVVPPAVRAASAQRRTRRRLTRLSSSGYLSLHARAIPGTGAVIDHLVVGPGGIYSVDSEIWDRRLPIRATRGGSLFHGPFDQGARLSESRWAAAEASRLMSEAIGQPVAIRPAMVIYGPVVPWVMMKISGVDVFCGSRLGKYLRREASANHAWRLDDRQTEAFHAVAAEVLPPAG